MKLKNILTFLFSLFIFTGCSTVEKSEFIEERNKKYIEWETKGKWEQGR